MEEGEELWYGTQFKWRFRYDEILQRNVQCMMSLWQN